MVSPGHKDKHQDRDKDRYKDRHKDRHKDEGIILMDMRDGKGDRLTSPQTEIRNNPLNLHEGRPAGTYAHQWARIRSILRSEFGDATYRSWLKSLTFVGFEHGCLRMSVPTRFMRDWILTHYSERIETLWQEEGQEVERIEIQVITGSKSDHNDQDSGVVSANMGAVVDQDTSAEKALPQSPFPAGNPADSKAFNWALHISAPLDSRFTFERFVVGKPNEFAFAAARRVAEAESVSFNPLFLYGGVGLGKTHLMHAIAWHIRTKHPNRRVIYLSAEKFMYQFIRALRFKDTVSFKEQFRSVDVLMIDDVQFISGKDSTQEEFFHTFNALVDQNRQIIISADKSPNDLEGIEERMRSRLGWGLVADIHPTNYELRLGILQAKAEGMALALPEKVLEFLAYKITGNVRELEGALNRIVAHTTLVGRPASLESIQDVLGDILRSSERRVSIEHIQKRVAEHFNIRFSEMSSARRARAVARPRQVAMYLAKRLTSRSLPEIGRKFGNRDHTTVMHAIRKVEELCDSDAAFREDVALLHRMLRV